MLSAGTASGDLASIWLPAGIAMAALMLARPHGWLVVIPALVCAQTLFGLLQGSNLAHSLSVALVLIGAPAVALTIVVRFARTPLHGLYFLRALFLAALIDSALTSVIDLSWQSGRIVDFSSATALRGVANFVGIFVLTPVFTAWSRFRPSREVEHGVTERLIGATAFAAVMLCVLLAFEATRFHSLSNNLAVGLSYVPLMLCLLIALMWNARGGALSVLLLAIVALSQTMARCP
ncbi:putative transmembrane protein [Candidatus Burkholderia brachyanthoides]|nr:putative transmembrane protein [Candidatus Burkholderia brachyanthoides]